MFVGDREEKLKLFDNFPDIMNITDMQNALNIGRSMAYSTTADIYARHRPEKKLDRHYSKRKT
jgi:hypothetical protein